MLGWLDALLGALYSHPAAAKHLLISLVLQPAATGPPASSSESPSQALPARPRQQQQQPSRQGEQSPVAADTEAVASDLGQSGSDWIAALRPKQSFQIVDGQELDVAGLEPARLIQCLPGVVR